MATAKAKPAPEPQDVDVDVDVKEAQGLPDEERLKAAAASAQQALEANSMAQKLKETASTITDPKKREQMLRDAYNKETEAHGSSKKARMLHSGAFQGGVGGAGIGGAAAAGVGTVVGTLVGTVTAIPATAVGGIVGGGVGAFHGPWIKLPPLPGTGGAANAKGQGKGKDKDKGKKEKDGVKKGEKGHKGTKEEYEDNEENEENKENVHDDDDLLPDPTALRQAADAVAKEREKQGKPAAPGEEQQRKKPRKIEIRSKPQT